MVGEQRRTVVPVLVGLGLLLIMVLVTPYRTLGVEPEEETGCPPPGSDLFAAAYGGTQDETTGAVRQTAGGGYIVAGSTSSFGANPADAWVLKLKGNGGTAWQKLYAGPAGDVAIDIWPAAGGGYVGAGYSVSSASGNERNEARVFKLAADGSLSWDYVYIGIEGAIAYAVKQLAGGGYIVAAVIHQTGTMTQFDPWVLKLEPDGMVDWEMVYHGSDADWIGAVEPLAGDGTIVAGHTESFGAGFTDAWVLKLDGDGFVTWQKTYGGASLDHAYDIQRTGDGGYIVAGNTHSYGAGGGDAWAIKLNGDGSVAWQKAYGGPLHDLARSVQQTADGGYILAGETETEDIPFGEGPHDVWLLKLTAAGSVAWSKTYGRAESDTVANVEQTADGGYVVAGATQSYGAGAKDVWVLRLDAGGSLCAGCPLGRTFPVTVTDSDAAPVDSTATIKTNKAKPANSNPAVQDTDAVPDYACACGLSMCKSVEPETGVVRWGAVTYTVVLSNDMEVDATGVRLTDTLPGEVTFGAWLNRPPGAQVLADELTWSGTVTARQFVTFSFTADHVGHFEDVVTNTAEFSHPTAIGSGSATFVVKAGFVTYLPIVLKDAEP